MALEGKLCEAEAACERLRSGVQKTEMEMSEVCVKKWVPVCFLENSVDRASRLANERTCVRGFLCFLI